MQVPDVLQELMDGVERTMQRAIEEEENIPIETVTNFDEVSERHHNFLHRFFKTGGGGIYFVYLYMQVYGPRTGRNFAKTGWGRGDRKTGKNYLLFPKVLVIVTFTTY